MVSYEESFPFIELSSSDGTENANNSIQGNGLELVTIGNYSEKGRNELRFDSEEAVLVQEGR